MIKLEAGKFYKDRVGVTRGPMVDHGRHVVYRYEDADYYTYTEDGKFELGGVSNLDLIEEVTANGDPIRSNIKGFFDDLGTIDTLEVITNHKVVLKNPWNTLALCEDTGNGYIFRFPSNSSCNQDNYICMSYSEARSIVLCLSNFKEDLGFQE